MPSGSSDTDSMARPNASCTAKEDAGIFAGKVEEWCPSSLQPCPEFWVAHLPPRHRCPHSQKSRPALHWLPRVGPPNHQTQSSWCSWWVTCRRDVLWVASHEPGFVFIGSRQSHVETSTMWAGSNTVHRRLQETHSARQTTFLSSNSVCPRVCCEISRRHLSRGGW